MKDKNKLIITIVAIILAAIVIVGATYAYWSWTTATNDQTNVTFTVSSGFSCGADGGGSITSQQKTLAPTSCTNPNYAFQRTITANVTNSRSGSVYMDLYLKVNQIGTGLSNSQNFKYALTRQANDCTSNIVSQGTFNGVTDNGKVYLFRGSEYPTTDSDTYYLYVWLDAAETDSATQNQTFNISLGGECSDNSPYVYTVNIGTNVTIGQAIPNGITQYSTPAAARSAFSNKPFYLKHLVSNGIVQESYVEFVVTSAMATANPGMTAGTYYLKGGDGGSSFLANAKTIYDAFGSNCNSNPYTTTPSSDFDCSVSGLGANARSDGYVYVYVGIEASCYVDYDGPSNCSG
jgi:hypothetical protein